MPPWAWTLAAQIVNIAILVLLIKRFLYKPVRRMLDERRAKVAEQMDGAARSTAQAEEMRSKYEKLLEQAKSESAAVVEQGKARAAAIVEEAAVAAADAAAAEKKRAMSDLEKETSSAAAALRGRVLDASLKIAGRLVMTAAGAESAAALTRDVAARVATLSAADAEAAGAESAAQLITSHPADDAAAALVKSAVESLLGRSISMDLSVDPSLILGAELRAGGLMVKSHVAARLREARASLEADDPQAGIVTQEPALP